MGSSVALPTSRWPGESSSPFLLGLNQEKQYLHANGDHIIAYTER